MLFLLLCVAIFGSLYILFFSVVEQVEEAVVVWYLLKCHPLTIGRGHKDLQVINFCFHTEETEEKVLLLTIVGARDRQTATGSGCQGVVSMKFRQLSIPHANSESLLGDGGAGHVNLRLVSGIGGDLHQVFTELQSLLLATLVFTVYLIKYTLFKMYEHIHIRSFVRMSSVLHKTKFIRFGVITELSRCKVMTPC